MRLGILKFAPACTTVKQEKKCMHSLFFPTFGKGRSSQSEALRGREGEGEREMSFLHAHTHAHIQTIHSSDIRPVYTYVL